MPLKNSISFLYNFDLGNRWSGDPLRNIISYPETMDGDFNISNIFTETARQVWRSKDCLTKKEIILKADIKSNVNCFLICGHNFTESAVVKISANISNNFLAPPVTKTIPYNDDIMGFVGEFGGEFQYYKISILDPGNTDGFIQIGRVVAGRLLQLTDDENITDSYSVDYKDQSEKMKSSGFFAQSNENIITRIFSANFQKLRTDQGANSNYKTLRKMFNYVKTVKSIFVILDSKNPYKLIMMGQINDIPNDNFSVLDYVNISFKVEEVF